MHLTTVPLGGRALGFLSAFLIAMISTISANSQTSTRPERVYISLWFDTEDYILPQSDDAALRVADLLTGLGVRATFKVVGEKARVLEQRGRRDVIAALKKHEIGYHSDNHSRHPTPSEYSEPLDWDTGVREFTRRERGGFDDVRRIFGQKPSCYGQPGCSWAPQSYAALREWGVGVYLDETWQVGLDGKPFWYGGMLNILNTDEGGYLRARDNWSNLEDAKRRFIEYRRKMVEEGGGIISIFFHPCEFVHEEFWDGVNFSRGANPPREEWKLPRMAPADEQERRYRFLKELVEYLKSFPDVRFVTASEAGRLYPDRATGHTFAESEILQIARAVRPEVTFQKRGDYALSPAEQLSLLSAYVSSRRGAQSGVRLQASPDGPTLAAKSLKHSGGPIEVTWNQFSRTVEDVADYLRKHNRVPNEVWLGSVAVSPETYLVALAEVAATLGAGAPPVSITLRPAQLAAARYVAEDDPRRWDWVIFPEGFRAPNLMALARLQAWTLKPAILSDR